MPINKTVVNDILSQFFANDFINGEPLREQKSLRPNTDHFLDFLSLLFQNINVHVLIDVDHIVNLLNYVIKKDSYAEREVRELARESGKEACFTIFNTFKKAHALYTKYKDRGGRHDGIWTFLGYPIRKSPSDDFLI